MIRVIPVETWQWLDWLLLVSHVRITLYSSSRSIWTRLDWPQAVIIRRENTSFRRSANSSYIAEGGVLERFPVCVCVCVCVRACVRVCVCVTWLLGEFFMHEGPCTSGRMLYGLQVQWKKRSLVFRHRFGRRLLFIRHWDVQSLGS